MKFKILTALITPFLTDGRIDYFSITKLIWKLKRDGCDGLVVCGTTAEVPTLSREEKCSILEYVLKETNNEMEIWFGCGSNNTKTAIENCKLVEKYPIKGVLIVAPYYNKPGDEGMFQHYKTIAQHTSLNIMMYNVPSRTASVIHEQTIRRLIEICPNIIGLKQASSDLECVKNLKDDYPNFIVYSGDDGLILEGIHVGMSGAISVAAHLMCKDMKKIETCSEEELIKIDMKLKKYCSYLFLESSPAPLKYILFQLGYCENILRLPLVKITKKNEEKINQYFNF